jgi:hypothetical protein
MRELRVAASRSDQHPEWQWPIPATTPDCRAILAALKDAAKWRAHAITLGKFAQTAPGRLRQEVQEAVDAARAAESEG